MKHLSAPIRASPFLVNITEPTKDKQIYSSTEKEVKEKLTGASHYEQNPQISTDCYVIDITGNEQNPLKKFFP